MNTAPARFNGLYLAWLAALAAFILLLLWAFFALRPPKAEAPRAARSEEQQTELPLSATKSPAPASAKAELPLPPAPDFDRAAATRLISAFSLSGLHLMDDAGPLLLIRAPGSRFAAQVIARDPAPGILVREIEADWQLDAPYAGANAQEARQGRLVPDKDGLSLISGPIPLLPLAGDSLPQSERPSVTTSTLSEPASEPASAVQSGPLFAPYPTLLVRARAGAPGSLEKGVQGHDAPGGESKGAEPLWPPEATASPGSSGPPDSSGSSGPPDSSGPSGHSGEAEGLWATRLVLPVSTEMACRNCHGGPWKSEDTFGLSRETALDILQVHDKRNGTHLAAEALTKGPVDCHVCHAGGGAPLKRDGQPNLSAAMHGFHAAMSPQGAQICGVCHAATEDGQSVFYRDLHAMWGLDCTRCHGDLAEHAISLLKYEAGRGSKAAAARLKRLGRLTGRDVADIAPRQPGENLPHCAGCHDFKVKPDFDTASAFNKWTASEEERFSRAHDESGKLRCPTCHGAPHALYPAQKEADNMVPMQYQGLAAPLGRDGNCAVCHTVDMDYFIHHERPE